MLPFPLLLLALCASLINATIKMNVGVDLDRPLSRPIPNNFVSYGVETYNAAYWFGRDDKSSKHSLVRLIRHIMHNEIGPTFRIGGNSGDLSVWNPSGGPLPANETYSITPTDLLTADNACRDVNGKVVWDVNFRDPNNPQHALDHISAIDSIIGWERVESLEIGNEPDLYPGNGIRNPSYTYSQYDAEFTSYMKAISKMFPNAPIKYEGMAVATEGWWGNASMFSYAKSHRDELYSISVHNYPLTWCGHPNFTIEDLLSDKSSQGFANDITKAQLIHFLDALDIPLFIGVLILLHKQINQSVYHQSTSQSHKWSNPTSGLVMKLLLAHLLLVH